ncbi:uncharacterized protein LOC123525341 [Mercenaria mercenaria]|uniref:uncharacterized protein LOC123525341 n=1 Tax=Mercenaria mercenaria TaxID=6596 RepID=UPI00234E58F4|nr:uncharacterized protein LOC123525341 [Mercenaria mercenaria]
MTPSMERYRICKPSTYRTVQDLLNFAPCPPPMLNYSEFREHALSRNLSHVEICNITRRCLPGDIDADENCSSRMSTTTVLSTPVTDSATTNVSRTPTTTEVTLSHATDYSMYSSTFSTEQTTYPPTSSSNIAKIIVSVICPIAIVALFIVARASLKNSIRCKLVKTWKQGLIMEL